MHKIEFSVAGVEHTLNVTVVEKTAPFEDPSISEPTDLIWPEERIAALEIDPLARDFVERATAGLQRAGYIAVWTTHLAPDLHIVVMPGEIRRFAPGEPDCPADLAGQRLGGVYWRRSREDAWSGPAPHGRDEALTALRRHATAR